MNMATFIAKMILKAREASLQNGQDKYRAYFVNTTLYLTWKADVDTIITTEGYAECIVTA